MPGKIEIAKDVLQVAVESGSERVGRVVNIVTGAVGDVATEAGGFLTDLFDIVDDAKRADSDKDD